MWPLTTRQQHIRETNRYQTDVTDEEWRVIGPYLPTAKSTGRPRAWPMREIINGIFYVMRSGCPWRLLPSDLPPWSTIYRWFATFRDEGRFEKINHALVMLDRERIGRQCSPTGAIIDSQSVKTTEAGGPRGYDAGKKINGRKRYALVDTDGRGLVLEPHPASIQDRDGGGPLLRASRGRRAYLVAACTAVALSIASAAVLNTVMSQPAPKPVTTSSGLQIIDTKVGTGASPKQNQTAVVHYTGWLYENGAKGKKFDSSVDRGETFEFPVGAGRVIKGWDEGVATMKVGGKRALIVPPLLGYGQRGAGGLIPPNATLMFDVELLGLKG